MESFSSFNRKESIKPPPENGRDMVEKRVSEYLPTLDPNLTAAITTADTSSSLRDSEGIRVLVTDSTDPSIQIRITLEEYEPDYNIEDYIRREYERQKPE
ncbi:MAG TPA: hypothetical protein VM103_00925 [Candidatus Paceibacterota bacterium]|nr:hypothetical protein [Candidatus Paceibacterota bacterium]